ncbi:FxsA family protein [Paracoccus sp. JM45]|uniref:FxsA family protein n=1 Tax=Paracoccus sp. JM45 TaxID=2283626 RepID=UPI000E6BE8D8|nr:FxsA family protein [Paracoccus sp. JM45]RJE80994.1 FxsA family protein [Paracoccus sp. JM45]
MRLFWLFLLVPIVEIGLFIQVGGLIGLWPTLAIVVLTAIVGTSLMRSQGAQAFQEVQRSFSEMRDPTRPLAHGVMILVAGMLLLTPGFFTDTLGMLLLIPKLRDKVMQQIASRVTVTQMGAQMNRNGYRPRGDDGTIDGEFVVTDPDQPTRPRNPQELDPPGSSGWTRD